MRMRVGKSLLCGDEGDDSLKVPSMGGVGEANQVMNPPKVSTEQLIALHGFFAEAAAEGEVSLADLSGCETDVDVEEVRATALAEFGELGLGLSEDLIAGVVGRLEGVMPGSLSLVLDPDEALLWSQLGDRSDPIATYVSFGRALLEGIASAFGELLDGEASFAGAVLAESPELAMLVNTHAPSDTVVLSARLRIDARDEIFTAVSHLLVEPKYLGRLLSALSAAIH